MQPQNQKNLAKRPLFYEIDCLLNQEAICELPRISTNTLFVRFFNDFFIFKDGVKLARCSARKQRAVLAFFLLNPRISWTKEQLISRFWSDYLVNSPENNLKVTLSYIRSHFAKVIPGHKVIFNEQGRYFWNPEVSIETDIDQFKRRYFDLISLKERTSGYFFNSLCTVIDSYSSSFLDEFRDEPWLQHERDQLQGYYLSCLELLSQYCIHKNEWKAAVLVNNKIFQTDHINEAAVRRLMRCYLELGETGKAIRQYYILKDQLKEFFGIEPAEETQCMAVKVLSRVG